MRRPSLLLHWATPVFTKWREKNNTEDFPVAQEKQLELVEKIYLKIQGLMVKEPDTGYAHVLEWWGVYGRVRGQRKGRKRGYGHGGKIKGTEALLTGSISRSFVRKCPYNPFLICFPTPKFFSFEKMTNIKHRV